MEGKNLKENEARTLIPGEKVCTREQALRTMCLLEKGTRQAFLDGEVNVEDTYEILGRVKEARERCEAGDVNACLVLNELVIRLTGDIRETA